MSGTVDAFEFVFDPVPGGYRFDVPEFGTTFEVQELRSVRGDLLGDLTVTTAWPEMRAIDGVALRGSISVSSLDARERLARQLAERCDGKANRRLDWRGIVEVLCQHLLRAEADGTLSSHSSHSSRLRTPVLSPAALHGLPGRVVAAVDQRTEAAPVAVLASFLTGFGSAVGSRPHVNVGADRHGANLFTAIVGPTSSGRKGASWSPVRVLLGRACPEWPSRIVSGLGSGEGLIMAVRDPAGDDPGEPDKRALVYAPEFAGVLSVMARSGATLSATLRDAFDTGDLRQTVKNRPLRATGAHVAMIAHITPDELRRDLPMVEQSNGFAGRILWIVAQRSKLLAHPPAFDGPDIDVIVSEIRDTVTWAAERGVLEDDEEAYALWEAVYPDLTRDRPGLAGAILSRGPALVRRLALVYALSDQSPVIRAVHLEAALALWAYAEESVGTIFGTLTGDPLADKIKAALANGPRTREELFALFDRHVSAARLDEALGLLVSLGRTTQRSEHTAGRARTVWESKQGREVSEESEASTMPTVPDKTDGPDVADAGALPDVETTVEERADVGTILNPNRAGFRRVFRGEVVQPVSPASEASMTAPVDRSCGVTDMYVAAVRRHADALADPPRDRDERELAHYRRTHWFAVQRLARAAEIDVLERERARQTAERGA